VKKRSSIRLALISAVSIFVILTFAACDPIVTIAGANFPGWLLCMIVGAALAALTRPLLIITGLESHVGPLTIFYPSLIAMFAMVMWVLLFNRV
jgi:hypothetical protein